MRRTKKKMVDYLCETKGVSINLESSNLLTLGKIGSTWPYISIGRTLRLSATQHHPSLKWNVILTFNPKKRALTKKKIKKYRTRFNTLLTSVSSSLNVVCNELYLFYTKKNNWKSTYKNTPQTKIDWREMCTISLKQIRSSYDAQSCKQLSPRIEQISFLLT